MAAKLWVLLVLSLSIGVSAQQEECYSGEWFVSFGLCFFQKWIDLLSGLAPAETSYRHDTMRSLQSMSIFNPEVKLFSDNVGVVSTVERLQTKAKHMQEEYFSADIMDAVLQQMRKLADPSSGFYTRKLRSEQKDRMKVLEKLAKVDTNFVINQMTEEAVSILNQLHHRLGDIVSPDQLTPFLQHASHKLNKTFNFQGPSFQDGIVDIFPSLADLLPLLPAGCVLCPGPLCFVPLHEVICSNGGLALLDELSQILSCFVANNYTEEHFEDGIEWMQCVYQCEDIPAIGECVQSVSSTCEAELVGDFFLEIVAVHIFGLGQCRLEVSNDAMEIQEGSLEPLYFDVRSYMPHTLYCLDFTALNTPIGLVGLLVDWITGGFGECPVNIQVSTHNYLYNVLSMDIAIDIAGTPIPIKNGWPRCMSGGLVNQALIGRHEYDGDCACSVDLTQNTWNETHTFPLWAAIDNKVDGDVTSQLTVKLRVKGFTVESTKITMNIVDRDLHNPVCALLGDPHVTTYDGYFYTNNNEGYFTIYKHLTLPYEVQIRQQTCSPGMSMACTCAVAVLSGDDVFVLDRCRESAGAELPPSRSILYLNGELNPGTRIFVKEDGQKYEVVLPIGPIITMLIGVENSIGVWVQASASDRKQGFNNHKVLGLCGTYDGIFTANNEQVLPDESGTGNTEEFINAWRVADDNLLFQGAASGNGTLEEMQEMCRCSFMIMFGVQCRCGHDQFVHLCDFNTDGEITSNIEMIAVQSEKQRVIEGTSPNLPRSTISIGESPSAKVKVQDNKQWDIVTAEAECREAVLNDSMVSSCLSNIVEFTETTVQNEINACTQDILLTNDTVFVLAAVESAKLRCTVAISQTTGMSDNQMVSSIKNLDCLYNCNNNGICNNGTCECDDGFTGSDCSRWSDATVSVSQPAITSCDTRAESCGFADLFGSGFRPEQYNMTLYVQQNELTSNGITAHSETRQSTEGIVISQSQVACTLPTRCLLGQDLCEGTQAFGAVYQLELEGADLKPTILIYDSVCYDCIVTDSSASCTAKSSNDYCVIDSSCYSNVENNEGDECSVCDPTESTSAWSVNKSSQACVDAYNEQIDAQEAEDREDMIRLVVAVALSGTVILVAIILFFTVGRRKEVKHSEGTNGKVLTGEEIRESAPSNVYVNETGVTLVKPSSNGVENAGYDFINENDKSETSNTYEQVDFSQNF